MENKRVNKGGSPAASENLFLFNGLGFFWRLLNALFNKGLPTNPAGEWGLLVKA